VDGSVQHQDLTVTYTMNTRTGRILNVTGAGTFNSNDGFGNVTVGTIDQIYQQELIRLYQVARVEKTVNKSDALNRDGSKVHSESTILNTYNPLTTKQIGVIGASTSRSDDGFGNITIGNSFQIYDLDILAKTGQARVKTNHTISVTTNKDGSTSEQDVTVTNTHDDFSALLVGVAGSGTLKSYDGYKGYTVGTIAQTYSAEQIEKTGQARVTKTVTTTRTANAAYQVGPNLDGTWTEQTMTVDNTYDDLGHLTKTNGDGTSTSDDGFGNLTQSRIIQTYEIIANQSKMVRSDTRSSTIYKDGSTNEQSMAVINSYDENGRMMAAEGHGTFTSIDASRNTTRGVITQTYDANLIRQTGLARVTKSVTESFVNNVDGSTARQIMTVNTERAEHGRNQFVR
jgi:hypothetical protein